MDARDIMTRDVVTLSPETPVEEAQDALLHYRIHGAPVVDEADQMIGMVSFVDLSAREGPGRDDGRPCHGLRGYLCRGARVLDARSDGAPDSRR